MWCELTLLKLLEIEGSENGLWQSKMLMRNNTAINEYCTILVTGEHTEETTKIDSIQNLYIISIQRIEKRMK